MFVQKLPEGARTASLVNGSTQIGAARDSSFLLVVVCFSAPNSWRIHCCGFIFVMNSEVCAIVFHVVETNKSLNERAPLQHYKQRCGQYVEKYPRASSRFKGLARS